MLISGLLRRALTPVVKTGRLAFAFVGGDSFELGDGSGPLVKARFTDTGAPLALLLDPDRTRAAKTSPTGARSSPRA